MSTPGFLAFRHDLASRAAALSFTANFLLMILKIVVGIISGSVAVLPDGIDSAEDSIAVPQACEHDRLFSSYPAFRSVSGSHVSTTGV